jgi:Ca-activated chloride channel family protein
MITLGTFALLRPWWLLCLPILWLLLRFTRSQDSYLGDWPRAIDASILDALMGPQRREPPKSTPMSLEACVVLIALSLSGPATRVAASSQFRNLDSALIIMNVSDETNLSQVTSAAQIVLRGCGARQTGLLLYAGDAYLASPLTYDLESLEALIFAINDQLIPDGGARPERALHLAHHILRRMSIFAGDVVLISDGAGLIPEAIDEARSLAADGHTLHTIFVTPSKDSYADVSILSNALYQLANYGHGLAGDTTMAANIAESILSRRINHVANGSRLALEWRDLGQFLILLAALPLVMFLRRTL